MSEGPSHTLVNTRNRTVRPDDVDFGFVCFELNSIRFIDLDPGPKQTIREPDPVHEK